jgi:cytokinin dehydrogenase
VMYYIELTKGFDFINIHVTEQKVEKMLASLKYIRSLRFTTDVSYFQFLNRIHDVELSLSSQGLWDVPHPWLNLFIPRSSISVFDSQVFKQLISRNFSGPILIYPINQDKWDKHASAVIPEERVFYLVALLRNALPSSGPGLKSQMDDNSKILRICHDLNCKQYFPTYNTPKQWEQHFGSRWQNFIRLKKMFDPRAILSPGQNIFCRNQILATSR